MRHATVAATAAALLLISAGPAAVGGSDDEPPYRVTADGLTLPAGDAFRDGGHVNIRYTTGAGEQAATIHFETLNQRPSGAYVGKQFLPWSALIGPVPADLCVTWVQVEGYDEHFGEGGQKPACTPATEPAPEPSATPEGPEPLATQTPATPGADAPDGQAPAPETSSPAAPPQDGTTEVPPAPGTDAEAPGTRGGGDTQPASEGEPATPRPGAAVTSGDVVDGALLSTDADAREQAVAPAGDEAGGTAADVEQLPRTGAAVAGLAVAAAALLGAGLALLVVRRRRRA